jgi:hypothetical protein
MRRHSLQKLFTAFTAFRPWLLLLLGTLQGAALHLGHTLSVAAGLAVLLAAAVWGMLTLRTGSMGLLCRLMLLIYIMPFTTCVGYLSDPAYDWPMVSSERAHVYAVTPQVVQNMLAVGSVGLFGLLAGINLLPYRRRSPDTEPTQPRRTLAAVPFTVAAVAATAASYIGSPTKTIFQVSYESSESYSLASQLNLNSANLVSYILLMILRIDAERDALEGRRTRWKFVLLDLLALLIIVYFQLLRGNRTFVGFAVGLMAMYITGPQRRRGMPLRELWRRVREQRRRAVRLAPAAAVLLFGLVSIGYLRFEAVSTGLSNINPVAVFMQGLKAATWTSILGTNLGAAGEYTDGSLEWRWGETWVHYVLSLPPGIISASLGIPRPIDGKGDPRVWYGEFSGGGVHPNVVPFCNLGAMGVLISHLLIGLWLARVERNNTNAQFWPRLMYATMFVASFLWFWYGDINLIRAVMITYLLRFAYSVALRVRVHFEPLPAAPAAEPT